MWYSNGRYRYPYMSKIKNWDVKITIVVGFHGQFMDISTSKVKKRHQDCWNSLYHGICIGMYCMIMIWLIYTDIMSYNVMLLSMIWYVCMIVCTCFLCALLWYNYTHTKSSIELNNNRIVSLAFSWDARGSCVKWAFQKRVSFGISQASILFQWDCP